MVATEFSRNFACRKCVGNIDEGVEQEEKLCDGMEIVSVFAYLGDKVSAGGGYEAAVTAKVGCELVKFSSCGELLY